VDLRSLRGPIRIFAGGVFFLLAAGSIGAAGIGGLPFALLFGLLSGICLADVLGRYFGTKAGGLIYPQSYFKDPGKRLASAQGLLSKGAYAEAQMALEEILKSEPDSKEAVLCLAKTLLKWKGAEGREEACGLLLWHLGRREKASSGDSETALLLCDLLEEGGLRWKAVETLSAELSKGYCRAEEALLRKRLDSLQGASADMRP